MFGTCRGFTLIEVLVVLSVLVITFSVLFELLLSARKDYELAKSLYQRYEYSEQQNFGKQA
jgi:prepilin-type N-terminal cleavage/methylation domain-containing protein